MIRNRRSLFFVLAATFGVWFVTLAVAAAPPGDSVEGARANVTSVQAATPATLEEARSRARLLHETMHATLHIVHHRYYREDEGLPLPAATLKIVFQELDRRQNVKLRWLVVDGQAMNVDHKPQDEFEKDAAKALASGEEEYERVEDGVYRHAGPITLSGECLKCHVPDRTSLEDRAAGLVISMPIWKEVVPR